MSNSIEIKIDGPKVTPAKFVQAVEAFFNLVQGVAKNVTGHPIDWIVEVEHGSNIVRTRSDNSEAQRAIDTVTNGIRSLRMGMHVKPLGFARDEIQNARTLAAVADGTSVSAIAIKNGQQPEELSEAVVKTADAILIEERSVAFGSIEGKLDALTDRDRFTCSVYEPNYRKSVACSFNKNELEDEAYKAFRKRVLISGLIRYGKEGYPTSIAADSIRVFPDESELPTVEEIQAIYKEIYK